MGRPSSSLEPLALMFGYEIPGLLWGGNLSSGVGGNSEGDEDLGGWGS